MSRRARLITYAVIAAVCVWLDQWAKAEALAHLTPGKPATLIPGVMDLLLVRNTGAAFSLGEGARWLFVAVAVAVVVGLAVYLWRAVEVPTGLVVCAGLVAGGGIGNLIDRVAQGWVCDFFATTFMDFAVFNVADIFVCVGVGAGIVGMFIWDHQQDQLEQQRKRSAASGVAQRLDAQEHREALGQLRGRLNRKHGPKGR